MSFSYTNENIFMFLGNIVFHCPFLKYTFDKGTMSALKCVEININEKHHF